MLWKGEPMDLIERQAAIDAVKKNTFRLTLAEEQNCEGHVAWSANAVYSDVMEGALLELPTAQQQRWIPCSDENPKADGRYLITGKMGTVYSLDFEDGRWYGGIKPVAWMPLPKPYAERREE